MCIYIYIYTHIYIYISLSFSLSIYVYICTYNVYVHAERGELVTCCVLFLCFNVEVN